MDAKEIIDLTVEPEVIILDSSDHEGKTDPSPHNLNGSTLSLEEPSELKITQISQSAIVSNRNVPEAGPSSQNSAKKKSRKKKKRKRVVALNVDGGEEGEIIEVDTPEDSTQVSREQSRERTISSRNDANREKQYKGKGKEKAEPPNEDILHSNDGFESAPSESDNGAQHGPKSAKEVRKREKKRKRREKVASRERDSTSRARSPSPPLFFVDDKPAEVPTNVKPTVPSSSGRPETKVPEEIPALLLPAHVTVMESTGDNPIEIIQSPQIDSDDDYIDYLDYDDDRRVSPPILYGS